MPEYPAIEMLQVSSSSSLNMCRALPLTLLAWTLKISLPMPPNCFSQALMTGDMILGCGTAIFEDFSSYMASLQRVLEMSPKYGGGFTK